jgi:RNA polymerase sigma-70 factor (ECF subfamily)
MVSMTGSGGRDDVQKFEALYGHARRVAAFFVRRYGVNRDTARDLVQEVYVKVWSSIDTYRGEAEWAFLERIAHRTAQNDHRAQTTQRRGGVTVPIDELTDGSLRHDDEDYAERDKWRRRSAQLHEAIAKLSSAQRDCLKLWLDDVPYAEIQTTLGITLDAVKTRLKEAKARLRTLMALPEEDQ